MRNHRAHYFGNDEKPRIEIIPMIDIMMFLLVFFMLVMLRMVQGTGLKLELPQSSTAAQLSTVAVTVGVEKDGQLHLDRNDISGPQLTARLKDMATKKQVNVTIAGDKGVEYETIIKTMDLVRSAGISSVALATDAQ
ncbi:MULTISPECIES: ExbD/TolR family protein [Paraburkholderia]|uniref:Biopolymer transporter ExbD n=1 Tax=Paraburkholderia podalyriae TaxID=1938811 RepID=A0ABR7PZK0_9BURK|nr:biopolymer transporter ExbD [Paraburkholderia podalyriae]MBC8751672.1 biopolymer transporter ExbD [Paraburkholderia podalyriae]